MTTNKPKPEVVAWMKPAPPTMNSVDSVITARLAQCASKMALVGYDIPLVRLSDYETLKAERDALREKLEAVEKQRPYWAKGYSTDSIAAQASAAALSELWELLGVSNQTDAVEKLQRGEHE